MAVTRVKTSDYSCWILLEIHNPRGFNPQEAFSGASAGHSTLKWIGAPSHSHSRTYAHVCSREYSGVDLTAFWVLNLLHTQEHNTKAVKCGGFSREFPINEMERECCHDVNSRGITWGSSYVCTMIDSPWRDLQWSLFIGIALGNTGGIKNKNKNKTVS